MYPYYVASLFYPYLTKRGRLIYRNSGVHTYPRRSIKLCQDDAEQLATSYKAKIQEGYGSLHNQEITRED